MLDINIWATIKIYLEYVLPILIIVAMVLYKFAEYLMKKIVIWKFKKNHKNTYTKLSSTFWLSTYCKDCGEKLYEEHVNTGEKYFNDNFFNKCKKKV